MALMPGNFWRVSKLSLTGYTFISLFYTQPFLLFVNSNYSAVVKWESVFMLDPKVVRFFIRTTCDAEKKHYLWKHSINYINYDGKH